MNGSKYEISKKKQLSIIVRGEREGGRRDEGEGRRDEGEGRRDGEGEVLVMMILA